MSIIYRIFILTIFYETTAAVTTTIGGICIFVTDIVWVVNLCSNLCTCATSIALHLSMYLMMDHNKSEYIIFLRILKKWKLNWICCNCRHIVEDQLLELEDNSVEKNLEQIVNLETTNIDTRDLSVPQAPKEIEIQLSEITMTQQPSTAL